MRPGPLSRNVVSWFVKDGYIWEWLVAIIAILIHEIVPDHLTPRDRFYTPGDPTLMYPIKANTLPSSALYPLVFGVPAVIFLLHAFWRRTAADGHHSLLCLAEGFALATGWKRWISLVGRLRPSWFATLMLHDPAKERDAREAYPSGHAAYMFFMATLLSCWALGKTHVLSRTPRGAFALFTLCTSPIWLAQYVAMTRLADYRHDFSDVNAGVFIGVCSGLLAYFINYPSLLAYDSHLPKLRTMRSPFGPGPDEISPETAACWPESGVGSYQEQPPQVILHQPLTT